MGGPGEPPRRRRLCVGEPGEPPPRHLLLRASSDVFETRIIIIAANSEDVRLEFGEPVVVVVETTFLQRTSCLINRALKDVLKPEEVPADVVDEFACLLSEMDFKEDVEIEAARFCRARIEMACPARLLGWHSCAMDERGVCSILAQLPQLRAACVEEKLHASFP